MPERLPDLPMPAGGWKWKRPILLSGMGRFNEQMENMLDEDSKVDISPINNETISQHLQLNLMYI